MCFVALAFPHFQDSARHFVMSVHGFVPQNWPLAWTWGGWMVWEDVVPRASPAWERAGL